MKIRYYFILTVILSSLMLSCAAQSQMKYYTDNKKAIKYFNGAVEFFKAGKTDYAVDFLKKAIEKDDNFIEAYLLWADINQSQNDYEAALAKYLKTLEINPDYRPKTYYQAASMEVNMMKFKEAATHLRLFLKSAQHDNRLDAQVIHLIENCDFAAHLVDHPVEFSPENLGDAINSESDEYANAINTENNMLIFTVKHGIQNSSRQVEDFFFSVRDSSSAWKPRQMVDKNFNTPFDEGAMVLSPDGKMIIFSSNRSGSSGRFDLYYSIKTANGWSIPKNMGKGVNTEYWESQPSISSDGKTVFFVSDRKGGMGGSDIYFATLQDDNTFGNPYNLGAPINTVGNEMTPYMHADAKTLFFTSNGHPGMGGTDIYISRKNENGIFDKPENIGYPINTTGNELGIVVNASGDLAYYSSDNSSGLGGFDIYSFPLEKSIRPIPVTYIKGIAYDKETKQKLQVKFELINLENGSTWIASESDKTTGEFLVCVPAGKELGLNAYKDGYLFYSHYFLVDSLSDINKPFLKDVPMSPLKIGEKIILRNILFATNSYELRPESSVELEKLFQLLTKNSTIKIEISGHTDNIGDVKANQILSENRAKSVYNYLINKGIDPQRLTFIGYGESQPVATNDTDEGRQANRRTEIKIIGVY